MAFKGCTEVSNDVINVSLNNYINLKKEVDLLIKEAESVYLKDNKHMWEYRGFFLWRKKHYLSSEEVLNKGVKLFEGTYNNLAEKLFNLGYLDNRIEVIYHIGLFCKQIWESDFVNLSLLAATQGNNYITPDQAGFLAKFKVPFKEN